MPTRLRWLLTAAVLALLGQCADAPTDVVVVVETDLPVDATLAIHVGVRQGFEAGLDPRAPALSVAATGDGGVSRLPASFGIVPAPGTALDSTATVVVELTSARLTVQRIVRFRFVPHHTVRLALFVSGSCAAADRMCGPVHCTREAFCEAQGLSCDATGACAPLDQTPVPLGDAGLFDVVPVRRVCDAGQCNVPCDPGSHACGAACVPDTAVASCGPYACAPCAAPENAVATCDGAQCGFVCTAGFHACGARCDADDDARHCGASCAACPAPAGASATCAGGVCGFACDAGLTRCGAACANVVSDAADCGACGNACGRNATCHAGVCTPCGAPGQICCADGCDTGADCSIGYCFACGAPGQNCCGGSGCVGGAHCAASECVFAASGNGPGGVCLGQTCDGGLYCQALSDGSAYCLQCGLYRLACCPGQPCQPPGLACNANYCY